jgi:hypothetical protein
MPKIDTPEVSKGFWVTVGVMLALLLLSLGTSLYSRAKAGKKA